MNVLACLLVACVAQEPRIADLYSAGDTAHWTIEHDSERVGAHGSRYHGVVALPGLRAHYFDAQVWLRSKTALGEVVQRFAGELWADDRGRPLRFELQAQVAASYSSVTLEFVDGEANAVIVQGRSRRELTVPAGPGVRILANNFISHFELLLALDPPAPTGKSERRLFSANTLKPFAVTFERDGTALRDSLGERIELADDGKRITDLTIARANVAFRRVAEPYEWFELKPPTREVRSRDDLLERDVTIANGDVELAGTLSRLRAKSGRLPAVFFVSGSGGQDRDGSAGGVDAGTHEILDRLVRAGFLVLRVDDRGVGSSGGDLTGASFDDLVADAGACVGFLLGHDGADPERVFVIGHSEGGLTAPLLAAGRPQLAGIVLMAAPGRSIIELMLEQNEAVLKRERNLDEAELGRTMAALRREMDRFCSDVDLDSEELDENFRPMLPNRPWFQSHARQDPIANVQAVKCPVVIFQGALDFQVSPDRDAKPLDRALRSVGHMDHQLRLFDGLDHLFKRVPGEVSKGMDYFEDRRVDASFLDALVEWLTERAQQ